MRLFRVYLKTLSLKFSFRKFSLNFGSFPLTFVFSYFKSFSVNFRILEILGFQQDDFHIILRCLLNFRPKFTQFFVIIQSISEYYSLNLG